MGVLPGVTAVVESLGMTGVAGVVPTDGVDVMGVVEAVLGVTGPELGVTGATASVGLVAGMLGVTVLGTTAVLSGAGVTVTLGTVMTFCSVVTSTFGGVTSYLGSVTLPSWVFFTSQAVSASEAAATAARRMEVLRMMWLSSGWLSNQTTLKVKNFM